MWGLMDLRRQARQMAETAQQMPERLTRLADELVLAAEEAAAAMRERSDSLADLVQTADDRIAALRGALARAEHAEGVQPKPVAIQTPAPRAADETFVPVDLAAPKPLRGRSQDTALVRQQVERAALFGKGLNVHAQVRQMAAEGMASGVIAQQLGLSKGEVEMILGLHKLDREGAGA